MGIIKYARFTVHILWQGEKTSKLLKYKQTDGLDSKSMKYVQQNEILAVEIK